MDVHNQGVEMGFYFDDALFCFNMVYKRDFFNDAETALLRDATTADAALSSAQEAPAGSDEQNQVQWMKSKGSQGCLVVDEVLFWRLHLAGVWD